jgi:hypothetical protein
VKLTWRSDATHLCCYFRGNFAGGPLTDDGRETTILTAPHPYQEGSQGCYEDHPGSAFMGPSFPPSPETGQSESLDSRRTAV